MVLALSKIKYMKELVTIRYFDLSEVKNVKGIKHYNIVFWSFSLTCCNIVVIATFNG